MGRIAGPPSKLAISNAWKQKTKKEKYLAQFVRPKPLPAVPHKSKRLLALLWAIGTYCENGLIVGRKGHPPYTSDMRELVRRGLLVYGRRWSLGLGFSYVAATELGKATIKSSKITNEQIMYIGNAFGSSSIR